MQGPGYWNGVVWRKENRMSREWDVTEKTAIIIK